MGCEETRAVYLPLQQVVEWRTAHPTAALDTSIAMASCCVLECERADLLKSRFGYRRIRRRSDRQRATSPHNQINICVSHCTFSFTHSLLFLLLHHSVRQFRPVLSSLPPCLPACLPVCLPASLPPCLPLCRC